MADQVGSQDVTRSAVHIETRDRDVYYAELRTAVQAERRAPAEQTDAGQMDRDPGAGGWRAAAEQFREAWAEHHSRWPRPDGERGEATIDADGGWHGDGDRHLDRDANETVDRGCERIREIEATTITPAMRRIEAQDPDRELIGFEHRIKGTDRLKEKVADQLRSQPELTANQALSAVPDSLRFTFCYSEDHYTQGVRADSERMQSQGFEVSKLRNSWPSEQYRGINSQWREPETGQRFEVQFHTYMSFEAKQLTHIAYERLRDPQTTRAERQELEVLQREICANVRVPRDAHEIEEKHGG
jgi:hypothetical protein